MPRPALGLIETSGIDGALAATRAASDAGQVVIVSAEQGAAGRMTVKIEGDWSAVQGAVEAGARAAHTAGELVSMHVIPKSDDEVVAILPYPRFVGKYRPGGIPEVAAPAPLRKAREQSVPRTPLRAKTTSTPQPKVRAKPAAMPTAPDAASQATPAALKSVPPQLAPSSGRPTWEQLEAMAVVKLRRYARTIADLPIKGRQISIANKEQLLEAIASARHGGR
ncbi:MAG: BMC domain-containing protein [Candidatus Zixiibacteriota bacterium]